GTATGRSLGGPWYSLLFNGDYDAYLQWYLADAVTSSRSEEEALEWWNIYNLEPGYELLAGTPGQESFSCFGDSGGPLAVSKKNKFTVYGVSFAVESSQSTVCTGGSAYLVLNEEMHAFVKQALAHCKH
ncbi:MAG TPA: trypsin-like serine protease, partial [Polyangiaceae bacterium]|nr:trypsin-like serine protease [Polyangiaceae bacterium]